MRKETKRGIIVVIGLAAVVVGMMTARRAAARNSEAEHIADISNSRNALTIDDLRKTIAAYEKELERCMTASGKSGTYWKILATRLQDKGQHGEALEALQHAVQYNPTDEALFYMTGVSAGVMGKSDLDFPDKIENPRPVSRDEYYDLAEKAYLRAIEINGTYDRPLYGLGVLYVFELNRPADAVSYLQRYIDLNSGNPNGAADAMFVLARAYYSLGEPRRAVEQYDLIMSITKDKTRIANAQTLRQQALGGING
jgi:tetratricopeptide (TPR) repeat protein